MTLLLLVLMGFHLHGEIVHEWAGIIFTLLIMLHLYLNRHRLWSLSPTIPLTMQRVNRVINACDFRCHPDRDCLWHDAVPTYSSGAAVPQPGELGQKSTHDVGPLGNAHSGAAYRVALENAGHVFLPSPEHLRQLTRCKYHYARCFFTHRTTGIVRITEPGLSRLFADEGRFLLFRLR